MFIALRDTLLDVFYGQKQKFKACYIDGTFVRGVCGAEQIGVTKVGKGSKIMAIVDDKSVPIAAIATSAQPHEISLVSQTLEDCAVLEKITDMVGDKA